MLMIRIICNATQLQRSGRTGRTTPGYHKIAVGWSKIFGQIVVRNAKMWKTKCLFTGETIKMNVHIIRV
jgi:hypothetical protein